MHCPSLGGNHSADPSARLESILAASPDDSSDGERISYEQGQDVPSELPHFLISPHDGQFSPYVDRSPVLSPTDPGFDWEESALSYTPTTPHAIINGSSPSTTVTTTRSRKASVVLQKLMQEQAQMMMDITSAWRKKFDQDHGHSFPVQDKLQSLKLEAAGCYKPFSFAAPSSPIPPGSSHSAKASSTRHRPLARQPSQPSFWNCSSPYTIAMNPHDRPSVRPSAEWDRLSLRELRPSAYRAEAAKVDVQDWKEEVYDSRVKLHSIAAWVSSLPADYEEALQRNE